jgi:23S rRNA (guanosine2251-2'-O)-methyltransferase
MIYVVLNNIRSAWNVGSIMRSCDALGYSLILIGYTPKPVGATKALIKKTAIGAEDTVTWHHFDHFQDVLQAFPVGNHIGIEISNTSLGLFEYLTKYPPQHDTDYFLWFGNEISGLEPELTTQLHHELHLPMLGTKESLNVATTVTAVGYLFLEHTLANT